MFLLVGGPQHSYNKALDVKVSMEWCGPPDGKGGVQEVVRAQWGPDGEDPWLGVTLAGRLYEGPPGVHGGPRHLLVVGVLVAETLPLLPHVQARHVRYGQAAGPPQAGEATWTSDIDRGELWGTVSGLNSQLSHTINTEIQFSSVQSPESFYSIFSSQTPITSMNVSLIDCWRGHVQQCTAEGKTQEVKLDNWSLFSLISIKRLR